MVKNSVKCGFVSFGSGKVVSVAWTLQSAVMDQIICRQTRMATA